MRHDSPRAAFERIGGFNVLPTHHAPEHAVLAGFRSYVAAAPVFVSTVKVKQAGFSETCDTELAVKHWLTVLMERKVIPAAG